MAIEIVQVEVNGSWRQNEAPEPRTCAVFSSAYAPSKASIEGNKGMMSPTLGAGLGTLGGREGDLSSGVTETMGEGVDMDAPKYMGALGALCAFIALPGS